MSRKAVNGIFRPEQRFTVEGWRALAIALRAQKAQK